MIFLPRKKHKTEWANISFIPKTEDRLELTEAYYILLRNETKYPYLNEKIAILSDPLIQDKGQVSFAISPKTFHLKKRNILRSTHSWSLEYMVTPSNEIKRAYAKGWLKKLEFQEAKTGNAVEFFIAMSPADVEKRINMSRIILRGPYKPSKEILPPWVMAPEFPPSDMFWRQPGEAWLFYVWLPYWQSLSLEGKRNYLKVWNAPNVWLQECTYINTDLAKIYSKLDSDIAKFMLNC